MAAQQTGVLIEQGPRSWQIVQRDRRNQARISLAGRWSTPDKFKQAQVLVRVVRQETQEPLPGLDYRRARMGRGQTWSIELPLPAGGLYRVETAVQLDQNPQIEWARRGDMIHHLGVGDVWVIAGQSNSAGYGRNPVHDPPQIGVHAFTAAGQWTLATHPLSDSTHTRYPLNRETANAGHSPYLSFAKLLQQRLNVPIGLIPAALGGSPVVRWDRRENGDLFTNMLHYIRDSGCGAVRGMVWYQGESDATTANAPHYARRFKSMVADLRRELKQRDLPVITAQLNRWSGKFDAAGAAGWERIRETQRQLARRVRGVFVVPTIDLNLCDAIHTDSSGNMVIAQRMAMTALGGVYGQSEPFRYPDLRQARASRDGLTVQLDFDHVQERVMYWEAEPARCIFAVRDAQGQAPVTGWQEGGATLTLKLGRPLQGKATVTAAAGHFPHTIAPMDVAGLRPIVAFTAPVHQGR